VSRLDALAERVSTCTAEWAQQQTGVPAAQIVEAARMFARGRPASSAATDRCREQRGADVPLLLLPVRNQRNFDRVGGNRRPKRPQGFKTYFDILFDPAFRLSPEIEAQRIGASQFPLWAARSVPDGLP